MRSVNLIPPDEQRANSSKGPLRTGPAAYIITGALAFALLMVVAMALTSKQVSDRTEEKQVLEADLAAATARADSLRAFTDFRAVQEGRTQTISSLAQSRFDWERVLQELSLVIPSDVWLIKMTGSVSPAIQIEGGAEVQIRDSIAGPALEIIGCAPDQDAVAGFVAALEDIDGVTRVGIAASERGEIAASSGAAVTSGAGEEDSEDCRTTDTIYQFEIAVAFDAVPTPAAATAPPAVPPAAPSTSAGGQLAATPTETNSLTEQTSEAQQATDLVPGG
jgi:Tfp pilus assembly protein PilN